MNVTRLLGFGFESNVYLILAEKIAVIDTGTGFYIRNLVEGLKRYVEPKDVEYIILTHEHFDHTGGAKALKDICNARICMHEMGAEVLEKGLDWSASFFGAKQPRTSVDIKLHGGEVIDLGNVKLNVIYTPGHSKGSICLYEEKTKSLFSGDTIFAHGGIGRTDFYGGDSFQLIQSIKRLKKLDIRNLYPGHGDYIVGDASKHIEMAERSASFLL